LVLDEADRMLNDETFKPDMETILGALPKDRQTLMFSATTLKTLDTMLPKQLILGNNHEVEVINTTAEFIKTVEGLDQQMVVIPDNLKEFYLIYILKNLLDKSNLNQAMIFVQTCQKCHYMFLLLKHLEFNVTMIHSMIGQQKRLANIEKFKASKSKILVATDVASRGLDIQSVDMVINLDLPKNPKDYVHRVGRTARAGRNGTSITCVSQYDLKLLYAIEDFVKTKLTKIDLDESKVLDD
jgi:ATP-dependent RNA helicase DDX49/DBP8